MSNEIKDKLYRIFTEIIKDEIYEIEKNEDSSDGNVYIINCKFYKYVVKIYSDKKLAKSMVMLHQKLFQLNINVPNIIYNNLTFNFVFLICALILTFIQKTKIFFIQFEIFLNIRKICLIKLDMPA